MKKITTAITALALATTAITAVAPTTTMAEYNYQTRGISEWDGRIFYETTYVVQDVKLIDDVRVINKTTGNTVEMPMLSLTEIKWNGDVMVSFNPYGDWGLSKNYDYAIEIPSTSLCMKHTAHMNQMVRGIVSIHIDSVMEGNPI